MSELSSKLNLPYLMPAQAQKHVTHNEALRRLDGIVQLGVMGVVDDLPVPVEGTCVIISAAPNGGLPVHHVYHYADGAWEGYAPQSGWRAWDMETEILLVYHNGAWQAAQAIDTAPEFERIGINTGADLVNRLSVKSPASLFDHDGTDHRLVINKAASADTASLVFQTAYTGHAEMGLGGDDDFRFKVSADGTVFHTALKLDRQTGGVEMPAGVKFTPSGTMLGHYETGSWTPVLFGSSAAGAPSYTGQAGRFVRIGNFVFASCELKWSALGGLAGQVRVGGLPHQIALGIENRAAITVSWMNDFPLPMGKTALMGFGHPYSDYVRLWLAAAPPNGNSTMLTHADCPAAAELYFNMSYCCE